MTDHDDHDDEQIVETIVQVLQAQEDAPTHTQP